MGELRGPTGFEPAAGWHFDLRFHLAAKDIAVRPRPIRLAVLDRVAASVR